MSRTPGQNVEEETIFKYIGITLDGNCTATNYIEKNDQSLTCKLYTKHNINHKICLAENMARIHHFNVTPATFVDESSLGVSLII